MSIFTHTVKDAERRRLIESRNKQNQRFRDKLLVWTEVVALSEPAGLLGTWNDVGNLYYNVPGDYLTGVDSTREDLARWIRFMKRLGAKIEKHWPTDNSEWASVRVEATFPSDGPWAAVGKAVAIAARNEVCEKVTVATREVTEEVPDPDLVAKVPTVTRTRTVEDIEWRCHPIMGGEDA